MSRSAAFSGSVITIDPPLNHGEIRRAKEAMYNHLVKVVGDKRLKIYGPYTEGALEAFANLQFSVEEYERETDEGRIVGFTCRVLEAPHDYLSGSLSMEEQINLLADTCPGHVFNGEICVLAEGMLPFKVVAKDVAHDGPRANEYKGWIEFEDGTRMKGNIFD